MFKYYKYVPVTDVVHGVIAATSGKAIYSLTHCPLEIFNLIFR